MRTTDNALSFIGHRSERLPQTIEQLEILKTNIAEIVDLAIKIGITTFYFGGCCGFELMCANIIIKRKRILKPNDPEHINLIAVIPYENQAIAWDEFHCELYYDTLAQCDEVITLHTRYSKECYNDRNEYLIKHSSKMICYYDGSKGNTNLAIQYAKKKKIPIINLYNS